MRSTRAAVIAVLFALGCGRDAVPHDGDGLDVSGLPPDVQRDYAVFANRCSKCHTLARPLTLASREDSDEYWARYVERMRRQPGSGISAADGIIVRRFLHYYTHLEKARHDAGDAGDAGSPAAPPAAPPPAVPAPPPSATAGTPLDGGP